MRTRVSAEDIRATPLRSISLPQLVAVHVMTLGDDALRHFFPRFDGTDADHARTGFDFRLADLADRLRRWRPDELAGVRRLADAVWERWLHEYPCELGYFSDCPSALDFLAWVFTMRDPFESVSKTTVLGWMKDPAIGGRLQSAFFTADSDEAARQLSNAHELWTVCATGP